MFYVIVVKCGWLMLVGNFVYLMVVLCGGVLWMEVEECDFFVVVVGKINLIKLLRVYGCIEYVIVCCLE